MGKFAVLHPTPTQWIEDFNIQSLLLSVIFIIIGGGLEMTPMFKLPNAFHCERFLGPFFEKLSYLHCSVFDIVSGKALRLEKSFLSLKKFHLAFCRDTSEITIFFLSLCCSGNF